MFTTAVNNSTATGSSSSGASGNNLTTAQAQQDRFLKLFVAQLNNQDPMNPMDNAQMTTQMAQINTVAGIETLNATIKSMSTQVNAMQTLQAATLVGRKVLSESSTLTVDQGVAHGSIDLAGNADKIRIEILSPSGAVVDTVNLGAKSAGRIDFEWNASNFPSLTNPKFRVVATQGGNTIAATGLARDTVTSVGMDSSGTLQVHLKGRAALPYSSINTIL